MNPVHNTTGVVLAGGRSCRMGTDKALLDIAGRSMIHRVVQEMARLFDNIILVAGKRDEYLYLGLQVIDDIFPGCGPLGGIHAGLKMASTPYVFVAGCDMPFVRAELMACLLPHVRGHDVVIPREGDYLEPLFAVYGKGCLAPVEQMLQEKRCKITGFYEQVRVKYIDRKDMERCAGSDKCFINVNTPDELATARRLAEDGEI